MGLLNYLDDLLRKLTKKQKAIVIGLVLAPILACATIEPDNMFVMGDLGVGDQYSTFTHTIGGVSIDSNLEVHSEGTTHPGGLAVHRHTDNNPLGGHILLLRSRGTHLVPTIVADTDIISRLVAVGYDGADYEFLTEIRSIVDGTPGTGDMPGALTFLTTPDGSGTVLEAMRIDNTQEVMIGTTTADTSLILDVASTTRGSRPAPPMTQTQRDAITTPGTGSLVYNTTTSALNQYNGAAWTEIAGGGGAGEKTYFTDGTFEDGIALASTYFDSGGFVDGTGGTNTYLTIAANTTTPLEDTQDLKMAKAIGDAVDEGLCLTSDTIDKYARGRKLYFTAEVDFTDSDYTSGDVQLKAFSSGTDAKILQLEAMSGLDDDAGIMKAEQRIVAWIQTNGDTDSAVRVCFHIETDSGTGVAWDGFIDETKFSPAGDVPGLIEKNVEIDLTGSGDFTAGTLLVTKIGKQVMAEILDDATFSSNATPASATGIIPDWARPSDLAINVSNAGSLISRVYVSTAGQITLNFRDYSGAGSAQTTMGGARSTLSYTVAESASHSLSTNELSIQAVKFSGKNNAGQTVTANTTDIPFTEVTDSHATWDGSKFTAPRRGRYSFTGSVQVTVAYSNNAIQNYIDGSNVGISGFCASGVVCTFAGQVDLEQDEEFSLRLDATKTLTASNNHSIELVANPDLTAFSSLPGGPPTIQKFTSGSGTYTTPKGAVYLKVTMVGAGGGGAGSGTASSSSNAANGVATTFGTSLLTANGGSGGSWAGGSASGGTATVNSPASEIIAVKGGSSGSGLWENGTVGSYATGIGGSSMLGGAGGTSYGGAATSAGVTNSGGGGAGGGTNNVSGSYGGAGGGSGAGITSIISNPDATYSYAVGAGGAAGSAGTSGYVGTAGGSGVVIVEEYY